MRSGKLAARQVVRATAPMGPGRTRPPRLAPAPGPRPRVPAQTVRDLIGIARLLYRTWRAANAGDRRLPGLVAVGKDLQASLTMAASSKPRTRQHREAWEVAEVATRRLGGILDAYVGVKPLMVWAFATVDESAEPSDREASGWPGSGGKRGTTPLLRQLVLARVGSLEKVVCVLSEPAPQNQAR